VQRIPNPGSDIDTFVRIFQELHPLLEDRYSFDLDDITMAMVARNNVSSQGAFGDTALARSTRKDRSRDPLYNQSKMYAELFRTLGWMQSTTSSLKFAFSWLGEHVASTTRPKPLVIECLLGIAYPNDILGVQGGQSIRIFGSILRAMEALGGTLSRDEMIAGPLSIVDDRDATQFSRMITMISESRRTGIERTIRRMESELGITYVTMGNYTRFPIAAMQWAGWAQKAGNRAPLMLTSAGRSAAAELTRMSDIRLSDYQKLPNVARPAFIRYATYRMLERAGFDMSTVMATMAKDCDTLRQQNCLPAGDVLFSPFQQVARAEVNSAFPDLVDSINQDRVRERSPLYGAANSKKAAGGVRVTFRLAGDAILADDQSQALGREIISIFDRCGGHVEQTVRTFVAKHADANQDTFYDLVAALFRTLGFDCRTSRRGVNYARADAMIIDPDGSIPIEIKSPGEETEISVKAVRQALENKVILLSRAGHPVDQESTSLVVGFNRPNERSEVHELVENIFTTFGIRIGILDFYSLVTLSVVALSKHHKIAIDDFRPMKGVVSVDRITQAG
jgi:hypothetical protein